MRKTITNITLNSRSSVARVLVDVVGRHLAVSSNVICFNNIVKAGVTSVQFPVECSVDLSRPAFGRVGQHIFTIIIITAHVGSALACHHRKQQQREREQPPRGRAGRPLQGGSWHHVLFYRAAPRSLHDTCVWNSGYNYLSLNQVSTKWTQNLFLFHINREYIMNMFMLLAIMATFVQVNAQTGGTNGTAADGKRIAHYVVQQCSSTLFLIF